MTSRNHRAIGIIAAATYLDMMFGLLFAYFQNIPAWDGLYFAVTTATTVGYGDITPHGWRAHIVAVLMMVTVIPLFAASFSLITTGLTEAHVNMKHNELKKHIDARHEEIKKHLLKETK